MAISNLRQRPAQKSLRTIPQQRLIPYPRVSCRRIETSKIAHSQFKFHTLSSALVSLWISTSWKFRLTSARSLYSNGYIPNHKPPSYQGIHTAQHLPEWRSPITKKALWAVNFILSSVGAFTLFCTWRIWRLERKARNLEKILRRIDELNSRAFDSTDSESPQKELKKLRSNLSDYICNLELQGVIWEKPVRPVINEEGHWVNNRIRSRMLPFLPHQLTFGWYSQDRTSAIKPGQPVEDSRLWRLGKYA